MLIIFCVRRNHTHSDIDAFILNIEGERYLKRLNIPQCLNASNFFALTFLLHAWQNNFPSLSQKDCPGQSTILCCINLFVPNNNARPLCALLLLFTFRLPLFPFWFKLFSIPFTFLFRPLLWFPSLFLLLSFFMNYLIKKI